MTAETILLSFILVVLVVITCRLCFFPLNGSSDEKADKITLDTVISDLKRTMDNVRSLQRTSDSQSKLIVKVYQIMKDSIENNMSQEEALKIIKGLNLPLKAWEVKDAGKQE